VTGENDKGVSSEGKADESRREFQRAPQKGKVTKSCKGRGPGKKKKATVEKSVNNEKKKSGGGGFKQKRAEVPAWELLYLLIVEHN